MIFGYFTLAVALLIEIVGAYYSITGLAAIFSGAVIPILIMGGSLELGKVTAAVWLKNNWDRAGLQYKLYLLPAVAMLMLITSMGIFGYLSKAHNDQTLVSGDVQSKIAIYDEKIKTARENIEADRRQLRQMDDAVDQVMARSTSESGADKSNAIRRSQARDRAALAKSIESNQKTISQLNDEAAPIRAEVRKVEAEVGPIKYIAKLIYDDNPDANILEKAVTWVIMIIVAVFDPLALVLILAAQQTLRWARNEDEPELEELIDEITSDNLHEEFEFKEPTFNAKDPVVDEVKDQHTHIPVDDYYRDLEPITIPPTVTSWMFTNPVPAYEPDDGPLTEEQVDAIQADADRHLPTGDVVTTSELFPDYQVLDDVSDELDVAEPTTKEEFTSPNAPGLDASDERPGDYLTPQEQPRQSEAAPGRNRRVMHSHLVEADNAPKLGTASSTSFGSEFPANPNKGDVFLRVDYLPNRLFKFNGDKWIEVDKTQTDVYAYDEEYIRYLIEQIDSGRYDTDLLNDTEREQIQQYLNK